MTYQTWQTSAIQDGENCPQFTETSSRAKMASSTSFYCFHLIFLPLTGAAINFWPMLMHLLNIWCFLWSADNRTRKWPAHFADLVQCSASIFPTDLCTSSPISASPPLGTFSKFTKARWSKKKQQLCISLKVLYSIFLFLCLAAPPSL